MNFYLLAVQWIIAGFHNLQDNDIGRKFEFLYWEDKR